MVPLTAWPMTMESHSPLGSPTLEATTLLLAAGGGVVALTPDARVTLATSGPMTAQARLMGLTKACSSTSSSSYCTVMPAVGHADQLPLGVERGSARVAVRDLGVGLQPLLPAPTRSPHPANRS